ncbi:hypothetical protein [Anaerosporobacter faecicola]|uniref:hypothetical protein n=1 Tax=Anaerosporobacter faecicola TaxID=2718714 RepID=UPI00143B3FE2|nr:hypothetical protein [Anaerosporobacter faecicola]
MKVNKYRNKVLCLTLATVMALSGCGEKKQDPRSENQTPVTTDGNETATMDNTVLLSSLREKYGATESEYADDILYVDRSQSIQIPIGFDPFYRRNIESSCIYFIMRNCLFEK